MRRAEDRDLRPPRNQSLARVPPRSPRTGTKPEPAVWTLPEEEGRVFRRTRCRRPFPSVAQPRAPPATAGPASASAYPLPVHLENPPEPRSWGWGAPAQAAHPPSGRGRRPTAFSDFFHCARPGVRVTGSPPLPDTILPQEPGYCHNGGGPPHIYVGGTQTFDLRQGGSKFLQRKITPSAFFPSPFPPPPAALPGADTGLLLYLDIC